MTLAIYQTRRRLQSITGASTSKLKRPLSLTIDLYLRDTHRVGFPSPYRGSHRHWSSSSNQAHTLAHATNVIKWAGSKLVFESARLASCLGLEKGRLSLQFKLQDSYLFSHVTDRPYTPPVHRPKWSSSWSTAITQSTYIHTHMLSHNIMHTLAHIHNDTIPSLRAFDLSVIGCNPSRLCTNYEHGLAPAGLS